MDPLVVLAGAAVGAVLGFVFQRGRFCLNTAFRNIIYIKNATLFRSYLTALVVLTIGANLLEQFGLLRLDQARQEFAWLANMIGGYLFGIGMVLAGGCASGTWYRVGEGLVGSWMAALGFLLGTSMMKQGALSGVYAALRSITVSAGQPLTLDGVLGMNRWIIIAVAVIAAVAVVRADRTFSASARPELHWRTAGALVGLLLLAGWYLSLLATGEAIGISFTMPSEKVFMALAAAGQWDWEIMVLIGFPLGAYLSARRMHEFAWRAPRADVLVQQLAGGVVMGWGGMLAGGCPVGHGLTGLAALSLASLVSMLFIVLGCWSMVYLVFMRRSGEE